MGGFGIYLGGCCFSLTTDSLELWKVVALLTFLQPLVRDLWAVQLQKRRDKASHESGTDTEGASSRFSSSQEDFTDKESVRSRRQKQRRQKSTGLVLQDTLSLIYIGVLLLRIPLTVADLHGWINSGQLCYYRAAKQVPLGMLDRLPGETQALLEPQRLLSADALHRRILENLTAMHTDIGMSPPPLNHPLVLYRWVKTLCLPLEIYVAAQRLGKMLEIDFAYTVDAKARSKGSLRYPEIRLMGLIVIATKLLFPFDKEKRYPRSANDMSALKMDWDLWVQLQTGKPDTSTDRGRDAHLSFEDAFTMTEKKSVGLADDRLDEYLDWYESNIASEEVRERGQAGKEAEFRRALFRMFPTRRGPSNTRAQTEIGASGKTSGDGFEQNQGALRRQRQVPEGQADDVPRPGHCYPQFRTEDELHGTARAIYEKAAQLAGFSLRGMIRAIFFLERRLLDREHELRNVDPNAASWSAT